MHFHPLMKNAHVVVWIWDPLFSDGLLYFMPSFFVCFCILEDINIEVIEILLLLFHF